MPSRIRRVNSTLAPRWRELQIKTGLQPIVAALLMEEAHTTSSSSSCRVFDPGPHRRSSPSTTLPSLPPSLFAYMRALAALDPLQQLQCGLKLLG